MYFKGVCVALRVVQAHRGKALGSLAAALVCALQRTPQEPGQAGVDACVLKVSTLRAAAPVFAAAFLPASVPADTGRALEPRLDEAERLCSHPAVALEVRASDSEDEQTLAELVAPPASQVVPPVDYTPLAPVVTSTSP